MPFPNLSALDQKLLAVKKTLDQFVEDAKKAVKEAKEAAEEAKKAASRVSGEARTADAPSKAPSKAPSAAGAFGWYCVPRTVEIAKQSAAQIAEYVNLPKGRLVQAVRGSKYPVVLMLMWFGGGRIGDYGRKLKREGIIDECREMVEDGGKLVIVIHRIWKDPQGSDAPIPGTDLLVDLCHYEIEPDGKLVLYSPKESDMNQSGLRKLDGLLAQHPER